MTELNELRINRKYVDAADALDRVPTDTKWPDFEHNCNMHVVQQVTNQYSLARKCRVMRESDSTFLVLFSPHERNLQTEEEAVIPRYTRVREVRIVFLDDGSPRMFLKCTCCTFKRFGYPCRHIYAVLQREP
jgi:SWIM zinc finger